MSLKSYKVFCFSAIRSLLLLSISHSVFSQTLPTMAESLLWEEVLVSISEGADVNQLSSDGTTALHWAVYQKELALVDALLAEGADPNIRNDYGSTPMSVASSHGEYTIMRALLEGGGDLESPNVEGQTLLMAVARTGKADTALLLLERGADVNATESWGGQSALMWAAAQNQPEMISVLIEFGAEINARGKDQDWPRWVTSEPRIKPLDYGGYTPLLYAAREGCVACIQVLLDGGADINLTDLDGRTPLLMAMLNLHYEAAAVLIERGADIQRWDWWGRTALYMAIDLHLVPGSRRGDLPSRDELTALDIARTLLEEGAYVDMRLKKEPPFRSPTGDRGYTDGSPDSRVLNGGATAIHKASKAGDVEAINLLLEYGAEVNIANRVYEVTPILTAAGVWRVYGIFSETPISGEFKTAGDSVEIIELLLAAGANIHDRASNGQTVLHGAAEAGWAEVVQLAHDLGVDLRVSDVGGNTARDLALNAGHEDVVGLIDELLGH